MHKDQYLPSALFFPLTLALPRDWVAISERGPLVVDMASPRLKLTLGWPFLIVAHPKIRKLFAVKFLACDVANDGAKIPKDESTTVL